MQVYFGDIGYLIDSEFGLWHIIEYSENFLRWTKSITR